MLEGEGSGVSCGLGQLELGVRRNPRLSPNSVAATLRLVLVVLPRLRTAGGWPPWHILREISVYS